MLFCFNVPVGRPRKPTWDIPHVNAVCQERFVVGVEPDKADTSDVELALSPPRPGVTEAKVGRNDPCPCGSGKKYKKCCAWAATSAGWSTSTPGYRVRPGSG
jgi:preprotein translocase subunit SecA